MATSRVIKANKTQHCRHASLPRVDKRKGRRRPVTMIPRPVPPVTIPRAPPSLLFSNQAMGRVVMEI